MVPVSTLSPDRLRSAPPELMPVPFKLIALGTVMLPWSASAAPEDTVTVPEPSAPLSAAVSWPPDTETLPSVLLADSVRLPVPDLLSATPPASVMVEATLASPEPVIPATKPSVGVPLATVMAALEDRVSELPLLIPIVLLPVRVTVPVMVLAPVWLCRLPWLK